MLMNNILGTEKGKEKCKMEEGIELPLMVIVA